MPKTAALLARYSAKQVSGIDGGFVSELFDAEGVRAVELLIAHGIGHMQL